MLKKRKSILAYITVGLLLMTCCKSTVPDKPVAAWESPRGSPQSSELKTPRISPEPRDLISAAWQGDAKQVEALLDAGANVNACDEKLGCPLVAASYSGNLDAVNLLMDRGAKVNAQDSKGMTALMNASLNGKTDVVRLLLSKGADVNVTTYPLVDGRKTKATALRLAKGRGSSDIVSLLVQAGAKE